MIYILIPVYLGGICLSFFAIGYLSDDDSTFLKFLLAFVWPLVMVLYLMIGMFGPCYYCGLKCKEKRGEVPKPLKSNITPVVSNVEVGQHNKASIIAPYN